MIAKALFVRQSLATLAAMLMLGACSSGEGKGESEQPGTDAAQEAQIETEESTEQAAPVQSEIPAHFRAIGTEPFWAVTNGSAGLRYMTPENGEGTAVDITSQSAQAQMRMVTGTLDGKLFALEINLATCSDGMSDRVYPFTAKLRLGDELHTGCARPMDS